MRGLADAFKEGREDGEINFPDISSQVLEKVIEYFHYKVRGRNC